MTGLTGTPALVRLAVRLDRLRLPLWTAGVGGVVVATASAFQSLYPTVADRAPLAATLGGNPAIVALVGPAFDLSSIGGLTAWRAGGVGAVLTGLMALLTVVRHSRAEEETGRQELLGAGVVGRFAPLTAAVAVAWLTSAAIGAVVAVGLAGLGLPLTGAFALGLGLASAGWLFAAVAAVAAQLTEAARTAAGLAGAALGLAYLLRAAGDAAGRDGPSWLSWLSPIGWTQRLRPFASERWWVLALVAPVSSGLLAAAYLLLARRDLGSGLIATRPGPTTGGRRLGTGLGLAWRLQRGPLAGWAGGFAVLGTVLGAVAASVGDLLDTSPQLAEVFQRIGGGAAVTDAYLASTLGLTGVLAAAYGVQATLRLRAEETGLRAEPVLATALGRVAWAGGHLAVAVGGTAGLLAVAGLTTGAVHGLRTGDAGQVARLAGAGLARLPAALVLVGLAAALFGLAPRLTGSSWAVLVAVLLLDWLGPALRLDGRVLGLSPYAHVPSLPGGEVRVAPLAYLCVLAAALVAGGLVGFRRRDLG